MKMRQFIYYLAALVLAPLAALLTSCSVKEDREPCPCYVCIGFEDREFINRDVCVMGWRGTELFRREIDVKEYDPYWVTAVHKGQLLVSACMGLDERNGRDHYAVVPLGSQCDSLYAYAEIADATGDEVVVNAVLHKQFATVHVDICKSVQEMKDYRFRVDGNSCGFDLLDFSPVPGTFMYEPKAEAGARIVDFRLPRQADNSLSLTVWRQDEEIGSFPIGQYIAKQGYSWKAQDLQDIYVTVDFIIGYVIIGVDDWENGMVISFIEQ